MFSCEPVANYRCEVGENPLWDEREGRLYWVDIDTGRLFRVDHESGEHECFYRGSEKIGGFTCQEDGSLLLFEVDRIAVLGKDGRRRVITEHIDGDMVRFNDAIADPEGRVFAGSIGKTDQSGGLYRIDRDGSIDSRVEGHGLRERHGFQPRSAALLLDLQHDLLDLRCRLPARDRRAQQSPYLSPRARANRGSRTA